MESFNFYSHHGKEIKEASISLYWKDTYYLFEDNRLVSIITVYKGVWSMTDQSENSSHLMTSAELDVLSEMIIAHFGRN